MKLSSRLIKSFPFDRLHGARHHRWGGLMLAVCGAFLLTSLPAEFASAKELNIYSYRQPELTKAIFDHFAQSTGIKVNVLYAQKGMVDRIVREGRRSPADLILTVDISRLLQAMKAGVLQPVSTPALLKNVPAHFRDQKNRWYGISLRARALYASQHRVKPTEIQSYEELASPRWKGRVCTRSAQHSYTVGLMASIIAHKGEEKARAWATGFKANLARKPQGNDRAQIKAIYSGECDVSLGNHYYMAAMLKNPKQRAWAGSVYLIYPNQKEQGTHVNISGIALAKHAPNKKEAIQMMEFLTGPIGQWMIADVVTEYPVNPKAKIPSLIEALSPGEKNLDKLPVQELAAHRDAAIRIFDELGFE